jgi:hypothetical protein
MANEKHLAILKQGFEVWNKWREENPEIVPDLREANLIGANLSGADLGGVDLVNAILINANLVNVNLISSDLSYASFCNAALHNAFLGGADFSGAALTGASLKHGTVGYTKFLHVDLSCVNGLESVNHSAPSTIGIDTIYRSNGKIPDIFLKGAGIPDDMIRYIHSIAGAIQFYSCFISYSSKDREFAERLHADLQAKGVRCWFAPHDVQGGKKLHEQIDQAIRMYDKLLLILSRDSINSEWVKTEIYNARQRELKEGKQMLFAVSLVPFTAIQEWKSFDADSGKDLAREIREYYIPDFSNWKDHDSYAKAFVRLLKDLKAEGK